MRRIGFRARRRRPPGFALIATITVLVLLALVALGLLTLSTVTVRSANLDLAQSEARANARLSLMLALGELQKAMGPDSRISARAETLAGDARLGGAAVSPNTPKAWWVGVSSSDREELLGRDEARGRPGQPVVWLVSGLDPKAPPGEQIAKGQPFAEPVKMFEETIDTGLLTGGRPIEAGSVLIEDDSGREAGGFAYFIDDNGMKAQLAASHPELRNDRRPPHGGGVFPGTHDLGSLAGMGAMAGTPLEDYNKLLSLNDLPLIGADNSIARAKRFGYTTLSRGVLSDVREGGLKRDLTAAFEQEDTFATVFPNNSRRANFTPAYLVIDEEKLSQAGELRINGYIHWAMFRDYYNIKKHIQTTDDRSGDDFLDSSLFTKEDIFNRYQNTAFGRGELGPHDIGENSSVPERHWQLPYGEIDFIEPPSNTQDYRHNPITPVLARMHQNAWAELLPPASRGGKPRIRTNVQLWKSQYNPYNINLRVIGDRVRAGPRIIHYPQVYFTLSAGRGPIDYLQNGSQRSFENVSGFSGKRQTSVPYPVTLGPGRAHVCAFKDNGTIGRDNDSQNYDDRVRDLTLESIYRISELATNIRSSVTMKVDFVFERPSMLHGANSNGFNASHEVAQAMWAPCAFEVIRGKPGKTIEKTNVSAAELNENTMASFAFKLRSTREGGDAVRPLIDSNIRALLWNTKWDSPLGLDCLAAYSTENEGVVEEQIPQMNTEDNPKGYTYWGASDEPSDGYDRVILFDIPREDLVSLGQLQHASIGRFSYEPTYVAGNSYANLRIPLEAWKARVSDTFSTAERGLADAAIPGRFSLYDASYLVNEVLWDSYIFTTIPQVADNHVGNEPRPTEAHFRALLDGEALLPNPRFIPYEPRGSKFDLSTLHMPASTRGGRGSFFHNAGHLMVDGAFNVNSTSVDAWEAFLSGTNGLPYRKLTERGKVGDFSLPGEPEGVRFPRVQTVLGGSTTTDDLDENYWIGFRSLTPEEVRELAEAVVEEVRERGPFLTLGEFVNRKLEDSALGERGALQAALDATVNGDLDPGFEEAATHREVPEYSSQGAGFPGQLLQGDILQALSPCMTVRSDTFTIRAYGESRSPGSNEVRARAWCEATVQRYPDPVENPAGSSNALDELVRPSSPYGRSFRIVSFRWLTPEEV